KAIVGVVLGTEFPMSTDPSAILRAKALRNSKNETQNSASASLTLLAADMEGYSNLCQLVTLRHLGTTQLSQNTNSAETDGRPVTMQELVDHSRGVISFSPAASPASRSTNHFSQLKEICGDHLYIEVQHLSPGDGRVLREAEPLGRKK